jgi:hypothetical protein
MFAAVSNLEFGIISRKSGKCEIVLIFILILSNKTSNTYHPKISHLKNHQSNSLASSEVHGKWKL